MKTFLTTVILFCASITLFAQENTATVYLMRDTQSMGALTKFNIFVDDALICKLKNHSYTTTNLEPGTHKFSVQMTGKKAKANIDHFELEIERNKVYYLKAETPGSVIGSTSFMEITENSVQKLLPKLKEQEDCD